MGRQLSLFEDINRIGATSLAEFRDKLADSNCTKCILSESRARIVVSRGSPDANIMVVGRDPGSVEEKTGRPFTGPAGLCFDRLFDKVGIVTNQDMYISNTFRCRPPNNKLPSSVNVVLHCMKQCKNYLMEEIDLLKPSLIVALGKEAFANLYDKFPYQSTTTKVGDWVGNLYPSDLSKYGILFLYHPAYIVRNENALSPIFVRHIVKHIDVIEKSLGRGLVIK